MKTRTIERATGDQYRIRTATAFVPDRKDIAALEVGQFAPDCFGGLSEVVSVDYRARDINGRHFVGYHTRLGQGEGSCSMSMKEGELVSSVALTGLLSSAECIELETHMNDGVPQCHCISFALLKRHAAGCPCSDFNVSSSKTSVQGHLPSNWTVGFSTLPARGVVERSAHH